MTDEDREALAEALVRCGIERGVLGRIDADNVARILQPAVDAIARRRAAEAVQPFRELFAGGPDTACRTTWRRDSLADMPGTSAECVEVPMAGLRDAFARAEALTHHEEAL